MGLLEDDRIRCQEQVEKPVDEGHVDTQEQDDRFCDEEAQWTAKVFRDEFAEVDFDFFLLRMDAPVQSSPPQGRSFLDEHDGRVRLLEENEVQAERQESHYSNQILCPPPSEARVHDDEAADKGSQQWAGENGHGEDGDGQTAGSVIEHVGEDGRDDGKRAGTEDAGEEAGNEYGL